jgi:hypothetical protein
VTRQVRAHSDVSRVHLLQGIATGWRMLQQAQAVGHFRRHCL